jgi:hypothetical protein
MKQSFQFFQQAVTFAFGTLLNYHGFANATPLKGWMSEPHGVPVMHMSVLGL